MKRRHGDVLIVSSAVPEGAKKLNHLVLAEGEVTGHKHQIVEGEAELLEKDGVMYLSVLSETAILSHEEHKPQTLQKGSYRIAIQQDYSPSGWNRVAD